MIKKQKDKILNKISLHWLDCVSKIWSKNPIYKLRNHTHLEINGQFIRLWWILLLDHDLQLLLIFSSHAWFVTSNSSTHFEFQTVAKLASFFKELLFFLLMLHMHYQLTWYSIIILSILSTIYTLRYFYIFFSVANKSI